MPQVLWARNGWSLKQITKQLITEFYNLLLSVATEGKVSLSEIKKSFLDLFRQQSLTLEFTDLGSHESDTKIPEQILLTNYDKNQTLSGRRCKFLK